MVPHLISLDKALQEQLDKEAKHDVVFVPARGRGKSFSQSWGVDLASGQSITSVLLLDFNPEKSHFTEGFNMKVIDEFIHKEDSPAPLFNPLHVEWKAELQMTHKQVRQFRKFRRGIGLKKVRLPRKRKKALKKYARQTLNKWNTYCYHFWPEAQPTIDYYEKKLLEIAKADFKCETPDAGTSGNIIKQMLGL